MLFIDCKKLGPEGLSVHGGDSLRKRRAPEAPERDGLPLALCRLADFVSLPLPLGVISSEAQVCYLVMFPRCILFSELLLPSFLPEKDAQNSP